MCSAGSRSESSDPTDLMRYNFVIQLSPWVCTYQCCAGECRAGVYKLRIPRRIWLSRDRYRLKLYEDLTGPTYFFWHYLPCHIPHPYLLTLTCPPHFPQPLTLDNACTYYDNSILLFTMLASLFKSILYLIPQLAAQSDPLCYVQQPRSTIIGHSSAASVCGSIAPRGLLSPKVVSFA